ncbi:nectin-1 isoform X2 [Thunnus maccoyii]|uniref:nectin-1 isoform X2 n=1 Tax=Thunnus maccoyii TaxID=8240 RepID=UPI001C4CD66C|nr:nectin-1 isoform X2 [Thunnus maccoyii]
METYSLSLSFSGTSYYDNLSACCVLMSCNLLFVISASILVRDTQGVKVTGGEITVVQGETAILPCKLTDTKESLTQISWQKNTRGKPQIVNFFTITDTGIPRFHNGKDDRFQFVGSITDFNGSIQLSDVSLSDEGVYTCIFTLFPSGNYKTEIHLNLLGSRPPAEVKWQIDTLTEKVKPITNSTHHDNGTTTTVSSLFGVPTREINQHSVQCVVTSVALSKEKILPFTIQVYFSPMEVSISGSDNSFQCVTEANPPANFTWSRSDGSWPQSAVRAEGAVLHLSSMTSDLNGEYQCEASNSYGRKHGRLYLHVISGGCSACWTLFVLLILSGAAAAVWYFYKSGKFWRTTDRQAVPTTSGSPDGARGAEETVDLRTQAEAKER